MKKQFEKLNKKWAAINQLPNPRFKVIALLITHLAMKISLFFQELQTPRATVNKCAHLDKSNYYDQIWRIKLIDCSFIKDILIYLWCKLLINHSFKTRKKLFRSVSKVPDFQFSTINIKTKIDTIWRGIQNLQQNQNQKVSRNRKELRKNQNQFHISGKRQEKVFQYFGNWLNVINLT